MTDGTALFAAILADTADDTLRLVYADWLEENGQTERADFIRVQCKLATMENDSPRPDFDHTCIETPCPICRVNDRYEAVRVVQEQLFSKHWEEWSEKVFAGWTPRGHDPEMQQVRLVNLSGIGEPVLAQFRMGFVEAIQVRWGDWASHHAQILLVNPIREITLDDWPMINHGMTGTSNGPYTADARIADEIVSLSASEMEEFRTPQGDMDALAVTRGLCAKRWRRIQFFLRDRDGSSFFPK